MRDFCRSGMAAIAGTAPSEVPLSLTDCTHPYCSAQVQTEWVLRQGRSCTPGTGSAMVLLEPSSLSA